MVRPVLGRRTRGAWVPVTLVIIYLLSVIVMLGACSTTSSPSSSQMPAQLSIDQILAGVLAAAGSGGGEAFVQGQGDILLEPAGAPGPESFAGEVHAVRGPTTTFSLPGTVAAQPPTSGATGQVTAWSGGTPGLYGGSRSKLVCDKEVQLRFLEQNPDKAAAFCSALNNDPTLRWSGGNKVLPDQLRAYFAELTPLLLTRDTRVTNHGFRNGLPTPRQSVLQAGQGVLVDAYGVPRVRCECGNPLNPPQPVKTTPNYTGPKWDNFDPATIIVIQQTTVIVKTFVIVEVETGEVVDRPTGTSGEQDVPHETSTTTSSTTSSSMTSTTTTSIPETSTTTPTASTTVPPGHDDVSYVGGFESIWDTNWGVLTFTRNGTALHGEYTYEEGKIDATLGADGRTMEGTWAEAPTYSPPADSGRVIFTLSPDGQYIDGQWWYGDGSYGGSWTGTRK